MDMMETSAPDAAPQPTESTACSNWIITAWSYICASDPDRKQYLKSDIDSMKYRTKLLSAALALEGPKWLHEPVSMSSFAPLDRTDPCTEFASGLATADEWQSSLNCLSYLREMLTKIMSSTGRRDPIFSDMYETLGIIAYAEARIADVVEAAN